LICSETTASKAFKSIMSHLLQQVLGGTIDQLRNCSQQSISPACRPIMPGSHM
jgi:hypothetical protein